MKLVCLSDTHRAYHKIKIPSGDVFIHAGDIDAWDMMCLMDFNEWLADVPCKHKIIVAGNHDKIFATENALARTLLRNATYLENSGCEIEGVKFWGSPITPPFRQWYFMAKRGSAIKKYWDAIPGDTDVLITHGPALGILDYVPYTYGQNHAGCEELGIAVHRVKPKLHIFGHIHYCGGNQEVRDGTIHANVSVLDEDYDTKGGATCLKY